MGPVPDIFSFIESRDWNKFHCFALFQTVTVQPQIRGVCLSVSKCFWMCIYILFFCFNLLILEINFKNIYYFNIFLNKKLFSMQQFRLIPFAP